MIYLKHILRHLALIDLKFLLNSANGTFPMFSFDYHKLIFLSIRYSEDAKKKKNED